MIGRWKLVSHTYRQFTLAVRKHLPGASRDEIYREWNRDGYDPEKSAKRIRARQIRKYTKG